MESTKARREALRLTLVAVTWTSLCGMLALLGLAAAVGSFGVIRTQLLLTFIGFFLATIIVRIAHWGWLDRRRLAEQVLIAVAVSQGCFLLLVWTRWRMDPFFWRAWWITMVASVTLAHLLVLSRATRPGRDLLARATSAGAAVSGFILATLGLRRLVPPEVGPVFFAIYGPAAAVSVIGSLLMWRRRVKVEGPRPPLRPFVRTAWIVATHVAIFLGGFYLGERSRTGSALELFPAALVGLKPEELDHQVRSDFDRLKTVVTGLSELNRKAALLRDELVVRRTAENREYYLPEEDDRIRWNFVTYLSYRSALLRMVATYAGFDTVPEPEPRARCFMVGYAAAVASYDAALTLITVYGQDSAGRRKLNEAEPIWGLQAGMFDRIYENAANEKNLAQVQAMGDYYTRMRGSWRTAAVWPEADFDWLDARIRESLEFVRAHEISRTKAWISRLVDRIAEDAYRPIYSAQSILSTWIGDVRIAQEPPLIKTDQILALQAQLKPGDILLERRNWYLSNAFLPGFWPHGALYVGTHEDLRRLGVTDHPEVKRRLEEYVKPAHDGQPHTVIESVSEGVVFNSLTHSMHADYVAVLRPKLPEDKIAQAIARAFSHQGKPYDFEFDFFTSDKLVCTELVYRAYEGLLHFDLVRVMGRDTLPAIEIVKKFARERDKPERQLDFVLFLDGSPSERCARSADAQALCGSVDRQRAFHE